MKWIEILSTPRGLVLDRWVMRLSGRSLIAREYAKALGVPSLPCLLLTTTGARTGRKRTAVLPRYPDGRDWVVIASNGGGPSDPHWVANLRAEPDVRIQIDLKRRPVRARVAEGAQRERLWRAITAGSGPYERYQKMAAPRQIPVVVLSPR